MPNGFAEVSAAVPADVPAVAFWPDLQPIEVKTAPDASIPAVNRNFLLSVVMMKKLML
jgi:hypothetical protein